jgi:hypothetical protein
LINNGVGPAFIKDVKLHYEGETYNFGPMQFIMEVIYKSYPKGSIDFRGAGIAEGSVVPAGQKLELVASNDAKAEAVLRDLFEGGDQAKVQMEITYSSVYEETWVIKSFSYVPEKLE